MANVLTLSYWMRLFHWVKSSISLSKCEAICIVLPALYERFLKFSQRLKAISPNIHWLLHTNIILKTSHNSNKMPPKCPKMSRIMMRLYVLLPQLLPEIFVAVFKIKNHPKAIHQIFIGWQTRKIKKSLNSKKLTPKYPKILQIMVSVYILLS